MISIPLDPNDVDRFCFDAVTPLLDGIRATNMNQFGSLLGEGICFAM